MRTFVKLTIVTLVMLTGIVGLVASSAQDQSTATVEVRVWQDVGDELQIYISARPADGSWATLGTIPLPLDDGVSSSGRFRFGDISVDVPLPGQTEPATVEVRVWQDVGDIASIYISARPADGSWATLGTIPLPLDDGVSSTGRFRYGDISLDVPLPEAPEPTPVRLRTLFHGGFTDIGYLIGLEIEEGWARTAEHRYQRGEPWGVISARPVGPVGRTLAQYAESVRNGLEQEVAGEWPRYSLFEFTSMEKITVGEQVFYELRYRRQEAPQYCVVDVVERIAATEAWHGLNAGVRISGWLCEEDVAAHGEARLANLDSVQVAGAPSDYYTQALLVDGVLIKAAAQVDPTALTAAGDVIGWMLETARDDIVACLARVGAGLAIIPKDEFVTTLPEFAWLAGNADFTGRTYESMAIRGLGAVEGQPVSSTSEESLIGDDSQRDLNVTVHEFAHGIQNLCLTPDDDAKWSAFYSDALEANIYPGTHAMYDVFEFFAVFSSAYFRVTDELADRDTSRELIQTEYPDIFASLEDLYGTPGPPPERPADSEE